MLPEDGDHGRCQTMKRSQSQWGVLARGLPGRRVEHHAHGQGEARIESELRSSVWSRDARWGPE